MTQLTYGGEQHIVEEQCDGNDHQDEASGLPTPLQPSTYPTSATHYFAVLLKGEKKRVINRLESNEGN